MIDKRLRSEITDATADIYYYIGTLGRKYDLHAESHNRTAGEVELPIGSKRRSQGVRRKVY